MGHDRHGIPPRVLLPRVMGSGREWLRRWCTSIEVTGLPPSARPPYTLVSLSPGEAKIQPEEGKCQVCIPLVCRVRDRMGCLFTGSAVITLEAAMRLNCRWEECWRYQWQAFPCVRLACLPPCCNSLCFEAALEVLLEVYLIKWEACSPGAPHKPPCPDLPLYPPPCCWEKR